MPRSVGAAPRGCGKKKALSVAVSPPPLPSFAPCPRARLKNSRFAFKRHRWAEESFTRPWWRWSASALAGRDARARKISVVRRLGNGERGRLMKTGRAAAAEEPCRRFFAPGWPAMRATSFLIPIASRRQSGALSLRPYCSLYSQRPASDPLFPPTLSVTGVSFSPFLCRTNHHHHPSTKKTKKCSLRAPRSPPPPRAAGEKQSAPTRGVNDQRAPVPSREWRGLAS